MAAKIVNWVVNEATNMLQLSKYVAKADKEKQTEPIVIAAEFDLVKLTDKLFGIDYTKLSDQGKQAFIYLCKQKLMDTGASQVGDFDGKVAGAIRRYEELLEGKWTGERVNATGAAENRKIATTMKETARVVSLEGLIVKKQLYPDKFTAEDQEKLNEFLKMAAEQATKIE